MSTVNFPTEYQQVIPYLMLQDVEAFLQFSREVLGATEKMITRDPDGTYRHCEILIGQSVIMFSKTMQQYPDSRTELFVYVADVDAAHKRALELGATSASPVGDQPYGRSGGVKDTNGNTWWLTMAI